MIDFLTIMKKITKKRKVKKMDIKKELSALIDKAEEVMKLARQEINKPAPVKSNRFRPLNDGWVLDMALNLEWGPTSKKDLNYADAEKYCADLGGRLPTVKELFSLVDHDKYDPAIDKDIFPDTKSAWYWTATPYKASFGYVWCVFFFNGYVGDGRKGLANCVRPVRASQCALTV